MKPASDKIKYGVRANVISDHVLYGLVWLVGYCVKPFRVHIEGIDINDRAVRKYVKLERLEHVRPIAIKYPVTRREGLEDLVTFDTIAEAQTWIAHLYEIVVYRKPTQSRFS